MKQEITYKLPLYAVPYFLGYDSDNLTESECKEIDKFKQSLSDNFGNYLHSDPSNCIEYFSPFNCLNNKGCEVIDLVIIWDEFPYQSDTYSEKY